MSKLLLTLYLFHLSLPAFAQVTCVAYLGPGTCTVADPTAGGCRLTHNVQCDMSSPGTDGQTVCHRVTNMTGFEIFIGARGTQSDWQSFFALVSKPSNISSVPCTYPCPAVASTSWTASSLTCSGSLASVGNGVSTTSTDSTGPDTGSASYYCNNGSWQLQPGQTCATTSAGCTGSSQSWTVSASCTASTSSVAHGASSTATDSTGPDTGSASYTCNNGAWSLDAGSSCSTTAAPCSTSTQTWTPGGYSCSASISGVAHGVNSSGTDSTGPDTGSATYQCSNGSWVLQAGSSCSPTTAPCASTAQTWTVGGNTCTGSSAGVAHTLTSTATDADAGTNGSATYTCTNGAWSLNAGSTCNANCATSTPTWTVSTSCSASLAGVTHGNNSTATDSTGPDTGSATYACGNGSWTIQGGSTCAAAAVTCPAGPAPSGTSPGQYWTTQNGDPCTGTLPLGNVNDAVTISDDLTILFGTATWTCNSSGQWRTTATQGSSCYDCAPGETFSWTVGADTCTATSVGGQSSYNVTVTDSTGPATGSATFNCTGYWPSAWAATPNAGATCSSGAPACDASALENCNRVACPNTGACSPAGWKPIFSGVYIVDTCGCPAGTASSLECTAGGTVTERFTGPPCP